MAEYGIATYDANGNYNNYGIKPVTVVAFVDLATGQTSGSYSYQIPTGYKVGYFITLDESGPNNGRYIVASGNTITIAPGNAAADGYYPATKCKMVVYLEKN
ncbi:outer membrane protein [Escherichia phage Phagiculus]